MSVTEQEQERNLELERVEGWRELCLLEAGWPVGEAAALSRNPEVDLHRACDLLPRCGLELALSILV